MDDNNKGYFSLGLAGYEVKINDCNERVSWVFVGMEKEDFTHSAKISYTTAGRAYFRAYGRRIYLDECMRY
jgi:hypothetical protein